MAESASFDITTGCDLQEVDNAVNQARRELTTRYDFKNVAFEITYTRTPPQLILAAPDAYKLQAIYDVLQAKLVKRGVPLQNLELGEVQKAHGQSARQEIKLQQSITSDCAKKIVKFIKELKLKKLQATMLSEQVRVSAPSRDTLQTAIQALKSGDFGVALQFGNYR